MTDVIERLTLRQISDIYGMSLRHWQQMVRDGKLPGVKKMKHGKRYTYLVDAKAFNDWWERQLEDIDCQTQSISPTVAASGGSNANIKRIAFGSPSKQALSQKLKSAATA